MKRLLLNSAILGFWIVFALFSCSYGNKQVKTGVENAADTLQKARVARGDSVAAHESNKVNPGRDTTLRYKQAVKNNGRNQARIDSIKNELTKKKR